MFAANVKARGNKKKKSFTDNPRHLWVTNLNKLNRKNDDKAQNFPGRHTINWKPH